MPRLPLWLAVTAFMFASPPPTAVAANESTVTIVAPKTVKPGATFTVKDEIEIAGPDPAFITGGFMDFDGTRLAPTKQRCPATPVGTFAADTPQTGALAPGPTGGSLRERNDVRRTGTIRYCLWVINSRTYETEAAGSAYIKALARRKPRHAKLAAKPLALSGRTTQHGLPIKLKIVARQIRALSFTALFHCSDRLKVSWLTRLAPFAFGPDGRFGGRPATIGTINDAVRISGRVKGRRVTGSFSETYTSVLGNTCKSGTVKFTATAPKKKR